MTDSGKSQFTEVIPVLPTRDVEEAVHFYVSRLASDLAFHEGDYAAVRGGDVVSPPSGWMPSWANCRSELT